MIETIFRKIAKEEGADFEFLEQTLELEGGTRSPNLEFRLNLDYKGAKIKFLNSTGTQFFGNISCSYETYKPELEFELTTRSHFSSLFTKNNERLKLKTSSFEIQQFFKHSNAYKKLVSISDKTVFEPYIIGGNVDGKYKITTEYSLQFSDWTQSIKPLIEFHKEFVDFIS